MHAVWFVDLPEIIVASLLFVSTEAFRLYTYSRYISHVDIIKLINVALMSQHTYIYIVSQFLEIQ